jgi:hypothetical protein
VESTGASGLQPRGKSRPATLSLSKGGALRSPRTDLREIHVMASRCTDVIADTGRAT